MSLLPPDSPVKSFQPTSPGFSSVSGSHIAGGIGAMGTPLQSMSSFKTHSSTPITSVQDIGKSHGRGAATTIGDVMNKTHPAVTSVQDINSSHGHRPVTSVADLNKPDAKEAAREDFGSIYTAKSNSARNRASHAAHMRRREEANHEEQKQEEKKDPHLIHVGGTGNAFHDGGTSGFKKNLSRFFRTNRGTYSNLSRENKKMVYTTLKDRAKSKRTGSEFTRLDHKAMSHHAQTLFDKGEITREDLYDFKQIFQKVRK